MKVSIILALVLLVLALVVGCASVGGTHEVRLHGPDAFTAIAAANPGAAITGLYPIFKVEKAGKCETYSLAGFHEPDEYVFEVADCSQ